MGDQQLYHPRALCNTSTFCFFSFVNLFDDLHWSLSFDVVHCFLQSTFCDFFRHDFIIPPGILLSVWKEHVPLTFLYPERHSKDKKSSNVLCRKKIYKCRRYSCTDPPPKCETVISFVLHQIAMKYIHMQLVAYMTTLIRYRLLNFPPPVIFQRKMLYFVEHSCCKLNTSKICNHFQNHFHK